MISPETIDRVREAADVVQIIGEHVNLRRTGALRDRVAEMLRADRRVRSFRLRVWNEGGAGVTVAEFA